MRRSAHHSKRWFDGSTMTEHLRDALHLVLRVALIGASMGCL